MEFDQHFPTLNDGVDWLKIMLVALTLGLVNLLAFEASLWAGAGLILTMPLTLVVAFLLMWEIASRRRITREKP